MNTFPDMHLCVILCTVWIISAYCFIGESQKYSRRQVNLSKYWLTLYKSQPLDFRVFTEAILLAGDTEKLQKNVDFMIQIIRWESTLLRHQLDVWSDPTFRLPYRNASSGGQTVPR